MSDTSSVRSSMRASTFLNRPQIVPMGPRTRQSTLRVSHFMETSITSSPPPTNSALSIITTPLVSPAVLSESPPESPPPRDSLDLEEFGGLNSAAGVADSPPLTPVSVSSSSEHIPLPVVSEEPASPTSPISAPPYIDEEEEEEEDTPPASLQPSSTPSEDPTPAASPAKITPVPLPPPKLVPPPAIKFDTTPVQWKGLPLEAALWTVDSGELQGIVSRAIRSSAKESFIRLMTVDNLDIILPAELERLDSLKAVTQSKYKFLVHRRTMLFHALNSTSLGQQKDGEDGLSVVSRLATQLAETIADCDRQLEELLQINDQVAQINKLIDIHWASALAIALRKLNGSYARRTKDLVGARERINQLEAELDDAWKEAEKLAKELDDYEDAIAADDTVAVIETAEIVPVPTKTPSHTPPRRDSHNRRSSIPMPMTPTLMAVRTISVSHITPDASGSPRSPLSPSTASFVFPPPAARLSAQVKERQTEAELDVPDTVSIRSGRSTRSAKSTRSTRSRGGDQTHTSSLYAAKKRSHRASQSSLRLNTGHSRKHSAGSARGTRTPYEDDDPPPMPELPIQFSSSVGVSSFDMGRSGAPSAYTGARTASEMFGVPAAVASSALLHSDLHASPIHPLRRQASLDTVCTTGKNGPAMVDAYRGRAADDIFVRPQVFRRPNNDTDNEIQTVPRTPPYTSQTFASIYDYRQMNPKAAQFVPPRPPPKDGVKKDSRIPSMWMNADAVKQLPIHPIETSTISAEGSGSFLGSPISGIGSGSGLSLPMASPQSLRPSTSFASQLPPSSYNNATNANGNAVGSSSSASALHSVSATSERSEGHGFLNRRPTTAAAYNKLKGLTKRYSVSLPMFTAKSSPRQTSRRSG